MSLAKTTIMKSLNQILISIPAVFIILFPLFAPAQVVNESAKKRISIGFGMFTDIWMNKPEGMKTRNINQGVNVFGTYNIPFGKSNFSFAIGLGINVHNLYWNYMYDASHDSVQFVKIPDNIGHRRSKLTIPYFEIPMEFRFKTKSKFAVGVGFKVGTMVYAHSKWIGDDYLFNSTNTLKASFKGIKNLEKFEYGPTLRIGYKWFHINGYYALSNIFVSGTGIDMYPLSIGFVLMPF